MAQLSPTWNTAEREDCKRLLFHWARRVGHPDSWPLIRKHRQTPWLAALNRMIDDFNRAFAEEDPELFDRTVDRFVLMVKAGHVYHSKMHRQERWL